MAQAENRNNAIIHIRFIDLLDILDARATITVRTGENKCFAPMKVYDFLTEPELVRKYRNYAVVGIASELGITTVEIAEEI